MFQYQPLPQQPAPSTTTATMTVHAPWYDTYGIAITAGGGAEGFTGSTMRNATSIGGSWNVRGTIGTRSFLALEGLYIGSAQSINALGLSNHAILVGNGAQGNVRLNFATHHPVQPFLFGGAAWRHYSLTNSSFNTSDVASSQNVFETPVGLGVAAYLGGGFMFDVRAEYRWSWGGHLLAGQDDLQMDRWGVNGNLGFQF
jgi:hypothetical protein